MIAVALSPLRLSACCSVAATLAHIALRRSFSAMAHRRRAFTNVSDDVEAYCDEAGYSSDTRVNSGDLDD